MRDLKPTSLKNEIERSPRSDKELSLAFSIFAVLLVVVVLAELLK